MPEPLVDYLKFYKYYGGGPRTGNFLDGMGGFVKRKYIGYFDPPMGSFTQKLLNPIGLEIMTGLRKFAGTDGEPKAENFRGVRNGGVYFKWFVPRNTSDRFHVAADWVRDMGYEVEVEVRTGETIWKRATSAAEAAKHGVRKWVDIFSRPIPGRKPRTRYGSYKVTGDYVIIKISYDPVELPKSWKVNRKKENY